jgi:hypothetical protein
MVARALALFLFAGLATAAAAPQRHAQPVQPVQPVPAAPEPKVVEGLGDGELVKRIMLRRIRDRVVDRAVKDGVPVPGGGVRKVSRDEAEKLVKRITDDDILEYAKVKGAPVQGRLQDLLNWLWENREAIIRFLLSILSLFGDD